MINHQRKNKIRHLLLSAGKESSLQTQKFSPVRTSYSSTYLQQFNLIAKSHSGTFFWQGCNQKNNQLSQIPEFLTVKLQTSCTHQRRLYNLPVFMSYITVVCNSSIIFLRVIKVEPQLFGDRLQVWGQVPAGAYSLDTTNFFPGCKEITVLFFLWCDRVINRPLFAT